jgi:hypothetical protein
MALTNLYLLLSMSEVREPPVDCVYLLRATSPPHPPFLTEEIQGCRVGYRFETNLSGMGFVNALARVPLLTSLSVNLQANFLSSA